ncbi:hypothetical protein EDB83DRAFT_2609148 [Lactarius deliciosus]|nr:hypothetical protein EDB83DRAFT_2609148 [Lactarius deliciosus]
MSWNIFFAEGTKHLRCQDIDEAIKSFDKAVSLANDKSYVLYDSRSSAYEKKNLLEDALRDATKTIDIAPEQWHGYFRSARLLAALGQTDAALQMCSLALERLGDAPKHENRRRELTDLRENLEGPRQTTGNCPVSGMPVELLLTIFQISSNPVAISRVCHQWREIALSQPTLWHSLVLAAPAEQALLKVPEWYKRSRRRIEEFIIRSAMYYKGLLDLLRDLDLTQLKECHMEDVNAEIFFSTLSGGMRYVHQHLETLSICMRPHRAIHFGRHEHAELPWETLRTFSIINGRCDWARLSTSMHHLTSFEYKTETRYGDFGRFHEFLQANPGLEKLIFEAGLNSPHTIYSAPNPLTLAHLRHLELAGLIPFHIKRGNFSLPSLRILRMTELKDAKFTLTKFIEDEETSFGELVEFTARDCFLESQILTSVFLRAPKLEILNCTGDDFNVVAESLTKPCRALLKDPLSEDYELVPTKLPILCPALSVLDLSQSADLKTDTAMRIVKERIALARSQDGGRYQLLGEDGDRVVSCIRALKVDECPHIRADMLLWFRENVPVFSCRNHYNLRGRR